MLNPGFINEFPEPLSLRIARKMAAAAASAVGAADFDTQRIELAVGEALSNAYVHAYDLSDGFNQWDALVHVSGAEQLVDDGSRTNEYDLLAPLSSLSMSLFKHPDAAHVQAPQLAEIDDDRPMVADEWREGLVKDRCHVRSISPGRRTIRTEDVSLIHTCKTRFGIVLSMAPSRIRGERLPMPSVGPSLFYPVIHVDKKAPRLRQIH